MWQNSLISVNASVKPSKSWGIFFETQGDIEFTISNSGLAVRILMPREFLNGVGENETSFLSSTITNDYYYYIVKDGALQYPYKSYAPFIIEVHNPGYATFTPPQKIFLKDISAPMIAGTYNASIYTATSLDAKGLPDFPNAIGENVTIPVSMREDPGSIYGYVKDSDDGRIITSEGIIYARDENTGKEGRSYVNSTTGFFNITGLYAGEYRLSGSAGYCSATGFAYVTTVHPTNILLVKGQKTFTNFSLQRGSRINGYLNYINASFPYPPMRSVVDNGWFSRAGVAYLNYTVEAYFDNGGALDQALVGEYTGACQGDKSWDPYWVNGTRYSGFGPGTYRLKFWVFGYVQPEDVYVTIPLYTETQ
ncbi:MAG: hypothetical protein GTN76_15270, partial [Candidatus Aenigmarchaeota archaeon]|nr:hypothetical protein [Candidatus Aenigmarchaeota archaeon]